MAPSLVASALNEWEEPFRSHVATPHQQKKLPQLLSWSWRAKKELECGQPECQSSQIDAASQGEVSCQRDSESWATFIGWPGECWDMTHIAEERLRKLRDIIDFPAECWDVTHIAEDCRHLPCSRWRLCDTQWRGPIRGSDLHEPPDPILFIMTPVLSSKTLPFCSSPAKLNSRTVFCRSSAAFQTICNRAVLTSGLFTGEWRG